MEPVRVYVGGRGGGGLRRQAATAVEELERTGAFDRATLAVVTSTGNAWVNSRAAAGLEYLENGDSAVVSIQYSYLPSALSLLVEPSRAQRVGQELFEQVYERWSAMPAEYRPELLVYGESLGAYGGQAAFRGLGDVRQRTSGVLWVGPPHFSGL